ncbi:proteinral transcription factor ii-i repeat domain-containing protein 2a [Trichonephila clavata]|uniref:Proteinral transcription factor ii-i repeat domain-containing protein 2a n=1 Tax=Trichonephila clavata TaxID=2740835 RepID=A0A8X6LTA9_TRICU|nr:proteinral transcription factor ii-i repeat domain-containing protein 2a [Trichonephila clavata]
MKRGLKSQQSSFTKLKTEQEAATRASFRVALEIAKRGKPFTDGEMIKEGIIAVAEEMCPEKVNLLKTVTLDESTDVSDTAQVLIYIRGVDKSYEVHEELFDMYSIHGTTTGRDIFKGVEMAINQKNLRWKNLKCITTDGGKNMSGKDKGVVALVSKAVENDGGSKPLVLHCIIHQHHTTETEFPIDFAIETLSALKINFDTRFSDFDAIANQIKIFQNPFDTDIEILTPELQMEMIDLQCSDIIKNKYQNSSLLEFYKSLPLTQFDNLHKFVCGLFSVFGTTYLCEKTFSKMKYIKNVYRSKLTDEHLKSLLIIGTSKISPQLQTIVSGKSQLHKSH